jgi:hypothetical protein
VAYDLPEYCMLATPVSLSVLAARRCYQRGRFQFAIKDVLFFPWILLPVTLMTSHMLTSSFMEAHRVWILAAFQIAGAFFCWSYADSKIGAWRKSLSLIFGACIMSLVYLAVIIMRHAFHPNVRDPSDHSWLIVLAINCAVVALTWFLAAIKPDPHTQN